MISAEITGQCQLFLSGVFLGMCMIFAYDLLRIWRRVIRHGTVWIGIEDMFFWCGCAVALFGMLYRQNDGLVRGFVIAAVVSGMLLYHFGVSRYVVRAGVKVLGAFVKGLSVIFKPLFGPLGNICKKNSQILKKRLKKIWKAIKIRLCKI